MTDKPLVKFSFRPYVVDAFTNGDCGYLALAIHDLTDLPVVTVSAGDDVEAWCHVGVALPDGRIIDIEGVWDADAWCARWLSCIWGDTAIVAEWEIENIRTSVNLESRLYTRVRIQHWARKVADLIKKESSCESPAES